MTKFIKTLAVLLLCMFSANETFAHDFEVNGIYYNILSKEDLTCEVAMSPNYNYTGSVVIPRQVSYAGKVFNVTGIGVYAFGDCSGLTSITIPNSVTSIGSHAFYGGYSFSRLQTYIELKDIATWCKNAININKYLAGERHLMLGGVELTSVTIPNSVTSIGDYAFYFCKSLTNITIPNSVTSIGDNAFSYCTNLTSITIPNGVTSIADYAFCDCSNLKSVAIPNSVQRIGWGAFRGCSSLTSINIPNGVTSIEGYTFEECYSLTSVTIPNSVTSIGWNVFSGCM